jgi:hypothetical protein
LFKYFDLILNFSSFEKNLKNYFRYVLFIFTRNLTVILESYFLQILNFKIDLKILNIIYSLYMLENQQEIFTSTKWI